MDLCIRAEEEVSILLVHDDKVLLHGKGRLAGASSWSTLNGPGATQYISVSPKTLHRSPAIIPPPQFAQYVRKLVVGLRGEVPTCLQLAVLRHPLQGCWGLKVALEEKL